MNVDAYKLLKITALTSGRRILALGVVKKLAESMSFPELVAFIDRAIAHDRITRALDSQWAGSAGVGYGPGMTAIDRRADSVLVGIRDVALAQVAGALPDDPLRVQAEALVAAVFPHGVTAITALPYPEQGAVMENVVAVLTGPQAAAVAALGLSGQVARLVALSAEYRAALEQAGERLTFSTVRAARKLGQALLLQVVFVILGRFSDPEDPAHHAARAALLAPILEQDRAVRAYRKARRRVRDVDPDTGVEEPEPGSDATGGATGDATAPAAAATGTAPAAVTRPRGSVADRA